MAESTKAEGKKVPVKRWVVGLVRAGNISLLTESHEDEYKACREAQRTAEDCGCTTTVLPVWRVR